MVHRLAVITVQSWDFR